MNIVEPILFHARHNPPAPALCAPGAAIGLIRAVQAGINGRSMFDKQTKTTWVIGGGIEHMLTRNWTVRAEARYTDLGRQNVACGPVGGVNCNVINYRGAFSNQLLMGLAGLSLRF
jgi:opacity protein-like surface antigen